MYKRLICFFFIGMIVLLVACKQTQHDLPELTATPSAEETKTPMVKATSTPEPRATSTPEPSMIVTPTREAVSEEKPEATATPAMPSPTLGATDTPLPTVTLRLEPTMVGQDGILVDNELCKIQAVSLDKGQYYYVLHLSVENRTDKELKFYVRDVYVNRMECSFWECEVSAGETIEEEITLYNVEKYAGVTEISDITELCIPLEIYDESEVWAYIYMSPWEKIWSEPLFQQTIYYYPQGKEQYTPFSYERQPDDIVVVDNEELTLLVTGDVHEETGGYVISLFFENHTDKRVWYEIEELALNGFLCEPFYEWGTDLHPETGGYGAIEFFSYWKDETEGDTVTEISFSLSAVSLDYDYGFWEDFTVYLQGEELVQEYVYVPEERDAVLYDGSEALLALTDIELTEEDDEVVCMATAYLENKTEQTLYIQCDGAEETMPRAGEYLSDTWNDYVTGGKKRKVQLKLYSWEENPSEEGKCFVYLPVQLSIDVVDSYKTETILDETLTVQISDEGICIVSDNE